MLDIAPSEFLAVAIVALVVIGPKDLPKAMRLAGHWVGKARGVARQFRSGFDSMVREAELAEMEKKWAAENERIMSEHGSGAVADTTSPDDPPAGMTSSEAEAPDLVTQPVIVEHPRVEPGPAAQPTADKAAS